MSERVGLGDYLAGLPYLVGYDLTEQHLVAVGLSASGASGPIAAITWQPPAGQGDRDLAESLAATLGNVARSTDVEQFLLVGYGPRGRERTALLADALLATIDVPEPVEVHVDRGTFAALDPERGVWSHPLRLPDVAAAAVVAGESMPARTRDELMQRFAPTARPAYAALSETDAAQFATSPPSFHAEVATRLLDQLATPGHGDDPGRMAVLAHLATGDLAVRDTVIAAAAQDPARADALVRTYRGAPAELRGPTASVAATALYLRGATQPAIEEVLRHADRDGHHARLTALIETAVAAGMSPHPLRANLTRTAESALDAADARWHAERTSATRQASYPGQPTRAATSQGLGQRPPRTGHLPRTPGTEAQR